MKIIVPSNWFNAPIKASMLAMSKCVVGSSIREHWAVQKQFDKRETALFTAA